MFQRIILYMAHKQVSKLSPSPEAQVLERVLALYGANIVLKQIGLLYEVCIISILLDRSTILLTNDFLPSIIFIQGGCISSNQYPQQLKHGVLNLLNELKNDAVALVDTIAPNDFILNSPLGMSDGDVYKHIQFVLWNTPGTFDRPQWWQSITNWKENQPISKL